MRPMKRLTPREQDVLLAAATGRTYAEIATVLGIRYQTIKNHMTHIYDRLGATNLVEALAIVGWLKVPKGTHRLLDARPSSPSPDATASRADPSPDREPSAVGT